MRLIDADSMKADLLTVDPQYEGMIQWCITVLDAQPTIERKTGKWLTSDDLYETGICSCCKQDSQEPVSYAVTNFHYCPNCGAWMEGET